MDNLKAKNDGYELKKIYTNKLLRIKKVQEITGLSKSYIYQLVKQGVFPRSILLIEGGSAVAWLESEIFSWVNSRIAARDEEVA